jgi:hypothetical protein
LEDPAVSETIKAGIRSELANDPLSPARMAGSVSRPDLSRGLHPVLRYYHTGLTPRNATAVNGSTVECGGNAAVAPLVRNAMQEVRPWHHRTLSGFPEAAPLLVNATAVNGTNSSVPLNGTEAANSTAIDCPACAVCPPPRLEVDEVPLQDTPLGPPVWECHVMEDFNGEYSSHPAAVLPLGRCLQTLAARRNEAALAIAAAAPELTGRSPPKNEAKRAVEPSERALLATRSVWEQVPWMERGKVPSPGRHVRAISEAMELPMSVMWFNGHRIPGGRDWLFRFSQSGLARVWAAPLLLIHVLDPLPVNLTNRERAFTAAVAQVIKGRGPYNRTHGHSTDEEPFTFGNFTPTPGTLPPWTPSHNASDLDVLIAGRTTLAMQRPRPFVDQNQTISAASAVAARSRAYARLTRLAPALLVVEVNARAGLERVWAESQMPPLPFLPVYRMRKWDEERQDWPGDQEGWKKVVGSVSKVLGGEDMSGDGGGGMGDALRASFVGQPPAGAGSAEEG